MGNYWIAHLTTQYNHHFHLGSQNWEVVIYNIVQFSAQDKLSQKWCLLHSNGLTGFRNI